MTPQAVILDFGGVLTRFQSPDAVAALGVIAGLSADEMRHRYWQHRSAYDGGLPARDYWLRVLEGTRTTNAEATIAQLIEVDIASWLNYREAVWDLTRAFRAAGGRTAMLSNGVPEIVRVIRQERPLDQWFDVAVISCEVDCQKPDAAIYRMCLDQMGIAAREALFVDDLPANLDGARAVGLDTLHFTGDESVEALRIRLGL